MRRRVRRAAPLCTASRPASVTRLPSRSSAASAGRPKPSGNKYGANTVVMYPILRLLNPELVAIRQTVVHERDCRPDQRARSPKSYSRRCPSGVEICYQTFGDRRRRPAAAGDGPRRTDELVGPRSLHAARRAGLLRHPLRQPRHRSLLPRLRPGQPEDAGPRVPRPAGRGAVLHRRPRRRRVRPPRPPRDRGRRRGRRVDGRHDRPDDGHRPSRAGPLAHQHHVDDRPSYGRMAEPGPAADADRAARPGAGGLRRRQPAGVAR